MIDTLAGTDRFLITRSTTENADTFESLPQEFKDTITEVHPDIGLGSVGTYGIDLDQEWAGNVEEASNLTSLVKLDDYALGYARQMQHEAYNWQEEYTYAAPLVEDVKLPNDLSYDVPLELLPEILAPASMVEDYIARYYRVGPPLDQKREGACTGFGVQNFLNAAPLMSNGTNADAQKLYYRARQIDEWEGEDYDGSSVSAATRAAMELGKVSEWGYLDTHAACCKWILDNRGGLIYGMNWYEGMYTPNAEGYIRPTGKMVGGHCLYERGCSKWLDSRLYNSWGADWGYHGLAWMSKADKEYMWRTGQIEAVCATQIVR